MPFSLTMPPGVTTDMMNQIAAEIAADLAADIDFEAVAQILGWTVIEKSTEFAADAAKAWCETHIKGKWNSRNSSFMFERLEDAALFKLYKG